MSTPLEKRGSGVKVTQPASLPLPCGPRLLKGLREWALQICLNQSKVFVKIRQVFLEWGGERDGI